MQFDELWIWPAEHAASCCKAPTHKVFSPSPGQFFFLLPISLASFWCPFARNMFLFPLWLVYRPSPECLKTSIRKRKALDVLKYLGENLQKSIMYTLCSKLLLDKMDSVFRQNQFA